MGGRGRRQRPASTSNRLRSLLRQPRERAQRRQRRRAARGNLRARFAALRRSHADLQHSSARRWKAADVVALVRVRSGDFVYTEEELRDMVERGVRAA